MKNNTVQIIAMDYPLEQLDPDRFQQLAQSLIVAEFPGTQCFPVGQADGGRDAVAAAGRGLKGFTVFQAKFSRKGPLTPGGREWLLAAIEEERENIVELHKRGAVKYVIVTNVAGSARRDAGSMDKLAALLASLPIPAQCWWRDDINRRLDNNFDLKWAYPDLLLGPDIIRALLGSGNDESADRRERALQTAIEDQYHIDSQVKFRQVELQNNLLDLFVDVPAVPCEFGEKAPKGPGARLHAMLSRRRSRMNAREEMEPFIEHRQGDPGVMGAVQLLTDAQFQRSWPSVVLEGGPGQGKSTATQYLCQIHRMRLLRDSISIAKVPAVHLRCEVRVPLRVDLRDFSVWLSKRDPFAATEESPSGWHRSLEAFLAALIRHHSGGAAFSVDDLQAVLKAGRFLIVLDGLDEVADLARRRDVVAEIARSEVRLRSISTSLQMVVTSRPSVFADSPRFPEAFSYFSLGSVTGGLAISYATKWAKAKDLQGKESKALLAVLSQKMKQPHTRDLARNPMQLAILLTLIQQRGASLPDKRTALYDAYIELFLGREAEKTSVVRDHRDLLTQLHRYLAWRLHCAAEDGGQGNITHDDLLALVRDYLAKERRDPKLAEVIFGGMIERVVALVARVQGTYEFEVQPLREYFAARYLYGTTPYSPAGNERRGNLIDRFSAIASNPYWFNVARFFAGCFDKGQLPALVTALRELSTEQVSSAGRQPALLAVTLVADWVFAQYPPSQDDVIDLISEEKRIRCFTAVLRHAGQEPLVLSDECGRERLLTNCLRLIFRTRHWDFVSALATVVIANSQVSERKKLFLQTTRATRGIGAVALDLARALEVLSALSEEEVASLLGKRAPSLKHLRVLAADGHAKHLIADLNLERQTIEALTSGCNAWPTASNLFATTNIISSDWMFQGIGRADDPPIERYTSRLFRPGIDQRLSVELPAFEFEMRSALKRFVDESIRLLSLPMADWRHFGVWHELNGLFGATIGSPWARYDLALHSCGLPISERPMAGFDGDLIWAAYRARHNQESRLSILEEAETASQFDRAFRIALTLNWSKRQTLLATMQRLNRLVESLDSTTFGLLLTCSTRAPRVPRREGLVAGLPNGLGNRLLALLANRIGNEDQYSFWNRYLRGRRGTLPEFSAIADRLELQFAFNQPTEQAVPLVRRYLHRVKARYRASMRDTYFHVATHMIRDNSADVLRRAVFGDPTTVPMDLLRKCMPTPSAKPVSRIAAEERWSFI